MVTAKIAAEMLDEADEQAATSPPCGGVCPTCKRTDGYVNAGKGHWGVCNTHKVLWFIGSNLFSSWKDETEEEQRKAFEPIDSYTMVRGFKGNDY